MSWPLPISAKGRGVSGLEFSKDTMSFPAHRAPSLSLSFLANACRFGQAHFLVLFSSGRPNTSPRHTHCFATLLRAWGLGGRVEHYNLEEQTISWLPRGLQVRVTSLLPEPGVNLELHTTLRHLHALDQQIWQWGPFAINPLLYDRAVAQVQRLSKGEVRYKSVDDSFPPGSNSGGASPRFPPGKVSNAFHAISDLAVEIPRPRIAPAAWGEMSGRLLCIHLRPWLVQPDEVHFWVAAKLGLHEWPVVPRGFDEPRAVPRRRQSPSRGCFLTPSAMPVHFGPSLV
jgi:hypothetical protein